MSFLNCRFHSLSFSILVLNNYPNKMRKYFYLWKLLKQMSLYFIVNSHKELHTTQISMHFFPTVKSVENEL